MEIKDYLKVLGKRAWLLVMIPAVAGVVAGLIAVRQPQAYRTNATLQLPRDDASTPALIAQKVADFRAAATNPTVENTVSEKTGVPVRKIQKMKIAQVGDSSQLTLSYMDKTRDATQAKAVIEGIAGGAIDYLQAPEVEAGQQAVKAANDKIAQAQNDIAAANGDLSAIYLKIGSSTPDDDIKRLNTVIADAQSNLYQAQAEGDTVGQQIYQRAIDDNSVKLLALLTGAAQITPVEAQITDAQAALKTATDERDAASKQLVAATQTADLTISTAGQAVVRKTRVVKTAAAAVVAGFPIAIALVLALDAMSRRRREGTDDLDAEAGDGPPRDDGIDPDGAPAGALVAPVTARAVAAPVARPELEVGSEPALVVASRTARETEALDRERNGQVAIEPAVLLVGRAARQDGAVDDDDDAFADDAFADDDETPDEAVLVDEDDELADAPVAVEDDDEDEDEDDVVLAEDDADEEDDVLDEDEDELADAELVDDADEDDADEDDDTDDELAVVDEDESDTDDDADDADDLALGEDDLDDDDAVADDEDDDTFAGDDAASTNGRTRQPARVPDADDAFEEDDEGPEVGS